MKFKTKYLVKRIFAMALAVALLWSDSSIASLAQTMTGENGEILENPVEEISDNTGENEPVEETPDNTGESESMEEAPDNTGESEPGEEILDNTGESEPGEENPEEGNLEEEMFSLYNGGEDEGKFPDVTTTKGKGWLILHGVALPGYTLCLRPDKDGEEGDPCVCAFYSSADEDGSDPQLLKVMNEKEEAFQDGVSLGSGFYYVITDYEIGRYIFARYGVENEDGSMTYYHTESKRVGYAKGDDDATAVANGKFLQDHIDKFTEISKEIEKSKNIQEVMNVYIPEETHIKADDLVISDRVRLEAGNPVFFEGSIKTKPDIGDPVEIIGLTITNNNGTAVDASDAPVCLNDCRFLLHNANLLQVSEKTYGVTELNGCRSEFTSGGSILNLTGDAASMGEFSLGNTDLEVSISDDTTVIMLSGTTDNVKWNVEDLKPDSKETLAKLSPGTDDDNVPGNVINNAFYIEGGNGMISNTNVLTMKSVYDKWISPAAADNKEFSEAGALIIVTLTPENTYEVLNVPKDVDYPFRPYAVTGQYGSGEGSYSRLLPKGYLSYLVIDVTRKGGFPYGAQIAREWQLPAAMNNFVVLQYHADKSVELVCSVTNGVPVIKKNSVLAVLPNMGNKNRTVVNTVVNGENVEEPIVLAVYSELPAAQSQLAVYECEEISEDGAGKEIRILSDRKILTDGDKKVSLELNGGIGENYYQGDVFALDQRKCTVPEGKEIHIDSNQTTATLTIPEGTYGTLTITPHYKSSEKAAEAKIASCTLQITSIQNIKGTEVGSSAAGSKYYGTVEFEILSGETKPFLGVSPRNGEDARYNLKVTSSSISGKKVTVQYVLDLRYDGRPDGEEKTEFSAWESFRSDPPCLIVETTAGEWEIGLNAAGSGLSSMDEENGVLYLFDLEDGKAVYKGARILNGETFYQQDGGPRLVIPDKVTKAEGENSETYSVTAMAEGCLNNIYENGVKANVPEIVVIPASVTEIKGKLITDPKHSDLRQIKVKDGNQIYCTYGPASEFDIEDRDRDRDEAQYCALYRKDGGKTKLVEIASAYVGELAWRRDAEWTDDTYDLDFSGIYGFRCEESGDDGCQSWDGLLVENTGGNCVLVKAPGLIGGTDLLIPEGITGMRARALEDLDITTLVLPSTMCASGAWEDGAVTKATSIYVYSKDTKNNPLENLKDTLKGITFYGFVDENKTSALKTWAEANAKSRKYKFTAMEKSGAAKDYTFKTLREASKSSKGTEYYEVCIGEELTETFDFDIVSAMKNGYPGKTDLSVEVVYNAEAEGAEYTAQTGEFEKASDEYGRNFFQAVNPGVAKVVIREGDETVKTAYFAVRPDEFDEIERVEGKEYLETRLGEEITITAKAHFYVLGSEGEKKAVPEGALQEYEELGVLRSVVPAERTAAGGYDVWKIQRKKNSEENKVEYSVTPLLYQEGSIIKGGSGSEFILELFGERRTIWVETYAEAADDSWLEPEEDNWNPILEKTKSAEIAVKSFKMTEDKMDIKETPVDYYGVELSTLTIGEGGTPAYDGKLSWPQVACEVISGKDIVNAEIINKDGNAFLKLTAAKKDGKALVRVFMPYSQEQKDMYLTVSVGTDLVESFQLILGKDDGDLLFSSADADEICRSYFFDKNMDPWNEEIPVEEIPVDDIRYLNSKTGEWEELPSSKLDWKTSDSAVAALVKGDKKDKDKVTGIQLKGEGTVLVSATVKDTNKAAINILFTVWDGKPGFYNNSDSLDAYKKDGYAEYSLAVSAGVYVKDVTVKEAKQGQKDVSAYFSKPVYDADGKKIRISLNAEQPAAIPSKATKYTLTLIVTTEYSAGSAQEKTERTYEYPVTLTMGGPMPKAAVSTTPMDLSVPSGRTSELTVKLGDVTNSGITLDLDENDAVTKNFAAYFDLEKVEGKDSYIVSLKKNPDKAAAEIAKLFNDKTIKLKVASEDYKESCYVREAAAVFKMNATVPVLKPAGNGKVTVNTGDVTAYDYEDEIYKASFAYSLTDGFTLGTKEDGIIDMTIAPKQSAYAEQFTFREEEGQIVVAADPGLPKGAYTFTWTPQALAIGDTMWQTLKAQTITVTVTKSSAKISLSSAKLKLDRNYINTEAQTWLQFDETQIRTLCGDAYWVDGYDEDKIIESLTLTKAPKTVTQENSMVKVRMQDNWLAASVGKDAPAGEYKYEIVPYISVHTNEWIEGENGGREEERTISMALAPLTFSVQVTDAKPAASLTQTTITIDNNDMSARAFTRWNINGNYEYIDMHGSGDDSDSVKLLSGNSETQPEIWLEGNEIRVCPGESTLKGTYKYEITPEVVLDSTERDNADNEGEEGENNSEDNGRDENRATLKPVTLTVKVTSTRPVLKLAKSSLTVYNTYPGGESKEGYYAPAEAGTDVYTSNGYGLGTIRIVPVDAKTKAIEDNSEQKMGLSVQCYEDEDGCPGGVIRRVDVIPQTGTPAGTYKYQVYANLYDEDENGDLKKGTALEPVTLTVTVKNAWPALKLSAGSVTLPVTPQGAAERQGTAEIILQGPTECVKAVTEKTEYLVKDEKNKWVLTEAEPVPMGAYARIDTADDGTVTITSLPGAAAAAEARNMVYSQEVLLKGNNIPYTAKYTLTFSFKSGKAVAVLSSKTITVNKNYDEPGLIKLSLNTGEKITSCDIDDLNTKNKKDAIGLGEVESKDGREISYKIDFNNFMKLIETGDYTFRITPHVKNGEDAAPVEVKVKVTDKLPTVSASTTKAEVNKLDTRENTWQFIRFTPSPSYAEVHYRVAVTKGPAGANLSEIGFFPEGRNIHNGDLIIGSTDTEIPDGAYTVTITPYIWKSDGKRADLKNINITVNVKSPKVTAALQTPKMTIDVAAENSVDMRNSIVLTGTNAELVEKVYWKDWKLTKKPKGAGDGEIWLEDLDANDGNPEDPEDYGPDGKEFSVCWGDREHNYENGPRPINVTPGTYEFTLTPSGIRSCDGVDIPVPAAVKLTVTVKNTKPTVKYSKTSSRMNLFFTTEDRIYYTLSDPSWHLTDVDAVMTAWPKGVGEERSALRIDYGGDRLYVNGTDKVPEGTYTFLLEARAEKNGMEAVLKEQKYTVTVKNELPTVKAAAGKLTCNVLYSGSYSVNENPEDNFNKKQQTKLTLTKNYGFSHFEGVTIKFVGDQKLKYEAAKIRWYYYEDGTIAVNLPQGSVVDAKNYIFEVTPVIRGDETGTRMTLKPVKLTVAVENKPLKASAKASGKIDLLNREGSGITYKVTLSDKDIDGISDIQLIGPAKGDDESWKFDLEWDSENPAECTVRARDGEELSTKIKYNMQLLVHTEYGKVCYVPIQIQPTQSKLSLTTNVAAVTLFKQDYAMWTESESGEMILECTGPAVRLKASINNTEAGERQIFTEDGQKELWTENEDFRAWIVAPEEGEKEKSVKVQIIFASSLAEAKYKAGTTVKLPVYVDVYNQSSDTYGKTTVTILVNIKN